MSAPRHKATFSARCRSAPGTETGENHAIKGDKPRSSEERDVEGSGGTENDARWESRWGSTLHLQLCRICTSCWEAHWPGIPRHPLKAIESRGRARDGPGLSGDGERLSEGVRDASSSAAHDRGKSRTGTGLLSSRLASPVMPRAGKRVLCLVGGRWRQDVNHAGKGGRRRLLRWRAPRSMRSSGIEE
jgi:hypothetical protein